MIFGLSLAVLPGGKYLLRKAFERVFQVVMEFGSSLRSQSLALSFKEKGKSLSLMASALTPFSLIVSHGNGKIEKLVPRQRRQKLVVEFLPQVHGANCS